MPAGRSQLAPFFIAATIFIVLAPVFWMHAELPEGRAIARAYENAELYQRVYPFMAYGFERLRQGELPLWNAQQLCGLPWLANPQAGIFQPLNAIFLAFDAGRALAVHAFIALALMGACFTLFARALGLRFAAAVAGGVAYAFNGASAAAMSRPELLNAVVWAPLVFWALHRLLAEPGLPFAVLAGIATALLLLSGAPLLIAVTLLCAALYAVANVLREARPPRAAMPRRAALALAACVALGLSAIQWLPSLMWLRGLDHPWATLAQFELPAQLPASPVAALLQLIRPAPEVLPHPAYLGIGTLLLAPVALADKKRRRAKWFFVVLALASFALACGVSAVFFFPCAFAMAMLAALGFDALIPEGEARAIGVRMPWAFVLLTALALFAVSGASARGRVAIGLIALPLVFVRLPFALRGVGLVFALLLYADLRAANVAQFQHPFVDAAAERQAQAPIFTAAGEQALQSRVLISAHPAHGNLPVNGGMLHPVRAANGAGMPLMRDQRKWWAQLGAKGNTLEPARDTQQGALLNAMAARVLIAGPDSAWSGAPAPWRLARNTQGVDIALNDAALPRAYWSPHARAVPDLDAAMAAIREENFAAASGCTITASPEALARLGIPAAPAPPPSASVIVPCAVEDVASTHVRVKVNAPAAGAVVLADNHAPGWQARVDGKPVETLRGNGLFRAVAIAAGQHTIDFRYRPWPVYAGLIVSAFTAVVLLMGGVWWLLREG